MIINVDCTICTRTYPTKDEHGHISGTHICSNCKKSVVIDVKSIKEGEALLNEIFSGM